MVGCRAIWGEIWASGWVFHAYRIHFDSKVLMVILGLFGAFWFSVAVYLENGSSLSVHLNFCGIQFYVVIVCHLVQQRVKAPWFLVMLLWNAETNAFVAVANILPLVVQLRLMKCDNEGHGASMLWQLAPTGLSETSAGHGQTYYYSVFVQTYTKTVK